MQSDALSAGTVPADHATWERAEIARSEIEASQTVVKTLRLSERTRRRYLNPPGDTPFPLEYAYHLLGDVRGRDVLDLGCGSGGNTVLLALHGANVWGLDISPALIELAQQRLDANGVSAPVKFLIASAHAIDLPDASVDVVFGIAILHHLDLASTSAEVFRVLRPGGRAIFQEPVRNSRLIRTLRRLIPYRPPDISPFERPLIDAEVATFARPFRSMRMRAFGLPHVLLVQGVPALKRWIDAAHRLDGRLLRYRWLEPFAGVRVIELTK